MIKTPPGPTSLNPFTQALDLQRDPLRFFSEMARYGDVSFFHVGRIPLYLVSHPDLIHEILVTRARDFHKSMAFDRLKGLLGNGMLTSEDDYHTRQRRLAAPAFHRQRLVSYAEIMIDYAEQTNRRWQAGQEVDMAAEMMRLTLAIAGQTLFGADVEAEAPEVGQALTHVMHAFIRYELSAGAFAGPLIIFADKPKSCRCYRATGRDRLPNDCGTALSVRRSAAICCPCCWLREMKKGITAG